MNSSNIKVLLVAAFPPPPGGDSTWAIQYYEELIARGIKTDTVNTSVIGKRRENVDDSVNLFSEFLRSCKIWNCLLRRLRQFKPNIVHINTNVSSKGIIRDYITTLICKLYKVPIIIHCHTNVGFKIKDLIIPNLFFKWTMNNADTIIALNKESVK